MPVTLPMIAGTISTVLFVVSYLPMLVKAVRTKDLSSYSLGNLVIANVGNVVHSVYVYSLPLGPIWLLHTFYLMATAAMLVWYRRYVGRAHPGAHLAMRRRREQPTAALATADCG